jgi:hypothetical protein
MNFESLKNICIILGYPGTDFLPYGNLLDAHLDIAINHNSSCLEILYKYNCFSKDVLIPLICKSRDYLICSDRKYKYKLPNWFQKKCSEKRVEVVGDCFGPENLKFIQKFGIENLKKLQEVSSLPLKVVCIIQNPFNIVSDISKLYYHNDLNEAMNSFFDLTKILKNIEEEDFCKCSYIYDDLFIKDPMIYLMSICDFLEVKASNYFLECCSAEFFKNKEYNQEVILDFNENQKNKLNDFCKNIPFLKNYIKGN